MSANDPEVFEVDIHVRDVCTFGARLANACRKVLAGQAEVRVKDFAWWLKVLGHAQVRAQIEQVAPGYCESCERVAYALSQVERGSVDLVRNDALKALETLEACVGKLLEIQAEMRRRQRNQIVMTAPTMTSWSANSGGEDEARMRTLRWEQKRAR